MANVSVKNLVRRFGALTVLADISFEVAEGEFVTILGPSGCGKSTLLSSLAGLDRPTAGNITIGSKVVFDSATGVFIDAEHRGLGMMFQSYALWPHMTVAENLAFPLSLRGIKGADAQRRIKEKLELVDMGPFAARYPGELSGGQQQRVALARTLVYEPSILLLDEPLSNLDAKLRDRARVWLRELQQRTGVTTIYVTHDQSEALGLSDRIIVLNKGHIAQIGTPREIYNQPQSAFVADFVGTTNLLEVKLLERVGEGGVVRLPNGALIDVASVKASTAEETLMLSIRPERILVGDGEGNVANSVTGEVVSSEFQGAMNILTVDVNGSMLHVETRSNVQSGPIRLAFPREEVLVVPRMT